MGLVHYKSVISVPGSTALFRAEPRCNEIRLEHRCALRAAKSPHIGFFLAKLTQWSPRVKKPTRDNSELFTGSTEYLSCFWDIVGHGLTLDFLKSRSKFRSSRFNGLDIKLPDKVTQYKLLILKGIKKPEIMRMTLKIREKWRNPWRALK